MSEQPLSMTNITQSFTDGVNVLDGINLVLEPGSVTGLLGRNGAGKTTLMRVALGLLQCNSGEVKLFGQPAWNAPAEVRQRIGYVPQSDAPFNWMRVSDCLKVVASFYTEWDHGLVSKYLNEWDLDPEKYIQDLSQGQRQKVAILTAIGHRPDLLLLDEPVASLDPAARRQFLKALVELNRDLDRTILFSTHITTDLERVVADVAVLHDGQLGYFGELDRLKESCQRLHFSGPDLPLQLDQPGIENYLRNSTGASAFARDWDNERTQALARSMGISVVSESLPLEEVFLELTHD